MLVTDSFLAMRAQYHNFPRVLSGHIKKGSAPPNRLIPTRHSPPPPNHLKTLLAVFPNRSDGFSRP